MTDTYCTVCGAELIAPASISRGYCEECALALANGSVPDSDAAGVTAAEAIANVLRVFPGAKTADGTLAAWATPTSADGNAAYRAGLCIDCKTKPYSPGRPRCRECHQSWLTNRGWPQ
jgi:hypothetical protein